jgi:8-oxo-dGTP pyrophosphatase MutT (NUDIX family)
VSDPREQRPATPRFAATITLVRDRAGGGIEVFMVRRHIQSDFAPDVFVFPGGSVHASDREAEQTPGLCAPVPLGATTLGSGFRAAAIRECFEEAGVLLARRGDARLAIPPEDVARFAGYRDGLQKRTVTLQQLAEREGLVLSTDTLVHWAHWITPELWPKRFDTHFFLAEMPAGQEAAHDELETTESVWTTPEDGLAGFDAGRFPLVFATVHQLRELSGLSNTVAARERFSGTTPRTIMPRVVERDGTNLILLPGEE